MKRLALLAVLGALLSAARYYRPAPWFTCRQERPDRISCEAVRVWTPRLAPDEPRWEIYPEDGPPWDRARGLVVYLDRPPGKVLIIMRVQLSKRYVVQRYFDAAGHGTR